MYSIPIAPVIDVHKKMISVCVCSRPEHTANRNRKSVSAEPILANCLN
jgi:hypothetical protein